MEQRRGALCLTLTQGNSASWAPSRRGLWRSSQLSRTNPLLSPALSGKRGRPAGTQSAHRAPTQRAPLTCAARDPFRRDAHLQAGGQGTHQPPPRAGADAVAPSRPGGPVPCTYRRPEPQRGRQRGGEQERGEQQGAASGHLQRGEAGQVGARRGGDAGPERTERGYLERRRVGKGGGAGPAALPGGGVGPGVAWPGLGTGWRSPHGASGSPT